jgi:translation initiation factor 1 (eIF-1/SUI1)
MAPYFHPEELVRGTEVIEHAELIALASAAATALVSEMVRDGWASARAAAARIFRHGGEEEERRQLERLDSDQAQVDTLNGVDLQNRWQRRFITLVEDFPEAAKDLASLASRHSTEQPGGISQNATGNTAPVIQVGRDNHGNLNTGSK